MSGVLLVTCNFEGTTQNLRRSTADAIHAVCQLDRGCTVRERHLYSNAVPRFGDDRAKALATDPRKRSAAEWKAATFSEMLLAEIRSSNILVISASLENGSLPDEILAWSEHVGAAALASPQRLDLTQNKTAIVVSERSACGVANADTICATLHKSLRHAGVLDVASIEADSDGYPLRAGPIMLLASRRTLAAVRS